MLSIKNTQKGFDVLLLESINETLRNTLGENSIKESILQDIIGRNSQWNEIQYRIQVFSDALRNLDSSNIIEDLILETIYSKLDLHFEWRKDYTFLDYIKELHKNGVQRYSKLSLEKS